MAMVVTVLHVSSFFTWPPCYAAEVSTSHSNSCVDSLTQSILEIYLRNLLTSIGVRVLVPEVVVAFFELLRIKEQRESHRKQLR